jgi:hypothetical protein
MVWGLGFGVWGLGFGFGVWGLGLGFMVWGLGFGGCCCDGLHLNPPPPPPPPPAQASSEIYAAQFACMPAPAQQALLSALDTMSTHARAVDSDVDLRRRLAVAQAEDRCGAWGCCAVTGAAAGGLAAAALSAPL